jgi:hypothetical protein
MNTFTFTLILIFLYILIVLLCFLRIKLMRLDIVIYNANIIIVLLGVLISPIKWRYKILLFCIIIIIYRKSIIFFYDIYNTIYIYKYIKPISTRSTNTVIIQSVQSIFKKHFKLIHNFDKLPMHPTIYICNYVRDRYENIACMLIPRECAIVMIKPIMKITGFDNLLQNIITRNHNGGGDLNNIKNQVDTHIKKGTSVFVYGSIPSHNGMIGRVRKGMFVIAKQLGITITQVAIDYISHNVGIIPYQRFEIKIGETFHVQDPGTGSIKTRRFYKKSLREFTRKKFLTGY